MAVKDIAIGSNLELVITNGDFSVAESDTTHIELILRAHLGSFKQFPLVGMGIDDDLASSGRQQIIKRNMGVQLNNDGYKVNEILLANNAEYFVDAERVKGVE